jgi:hypothetical protein
MKPLRDAPNLAVMRYLAAEWLAEGGDAAATEHLDDTKEGLEEEGAEEGLIGEFLLHFAREARQHPFTQKTRFPRSCSAGSARATTATNPSHEARPNTPACGSLRPGTASAGPAGRVGPLSGA